MFSKALLACVGAALHGKHAAKREGSVLIKALLCLTVTDQRWWTVTKAWQS